jgi:hypothetical protein
MARAYGPEVAADLRGAGIGSAAWVLTAVVAATGAVELTLIDVLLVLAPLVVVPVGLVVAGRTGDRAATSTAPSTPSASPSPASSAGRRETGGRRRLLVHSCVSDPEKCTRSGSRPPVRRRFLP